jgi:hypothetical protein
VVSFDRSLLKGEAPGLSADFNHPLSYERPFKGTGTRDYNWLKVVWYDGSWLEESPADIQKFLYCPFNFILK